MQITKLFVGLILNVHDLSKNIERQKIMLISTKRQQRPCSTQKEPFIFVGIFLSIFPDNLVFSSYPLDKIMQLLPMAQEIRKYKTILKVFERRTNDPKFLTMPLKFLV